MKHSAKRLRLCRCFIVLLLCFIWGNSLLPGSVSGAISDWVRDLLSRIFPGEVPGVTTGGGLLRKIAHFTEFAALGASLGWLSGMLRKSKLRPLLYGFGAACVDETIQVFVPGRGPSLKDVGIDTCGVIVGMILLTFGHHLIHKVKHLEVKTQ